MKGVTLTQPWASLIALAASHPDMGKKLETRGWAPSYRGPLAIHAAKSLRPIGGWTGLASLLEEDPFYGAIHVLVGAAPNTFSGADLADMLPLGKIVAVTRLVGCYKTPIKAGTFCLMPTGQQLPPDEPERSYGNYAPDRRVWLLNDIRAITHPVNCSGSRGLWNVPPSVEAEIARRLVL